MESAFPDDTNGGAINLDCFRFKGETKLAYTQASTDKGYRNRLASVLIGESNTVCTREMGDLTANQAMANAGLSTLTTALATAGSIVTGERAANILSGAASGTNAARDHINAEVYRNALSTRVTRAIREERARETTALDAKRARPIDEYSVDDMIKDVNRYHQICSFFTGLDLVLEIVDRAGLYRSDPRRTAALAINNVRAQIASINRQLSRKGLTDAEKDELLKQRGVLRDHETELVKAWTALPAPTDVPPVPQPEPTPDPAAGAENVQ